MTEHACSYSFLGNFRQKDCLSLRVLSCSVSCLVSTLSLLSTLWPPILGITSFPEEVSTGKMTHAKNKHIDVLRKLQTLWSHLEIRFWLYVLKFNLKYNTRQYRSQGPHMQSHVNKGPSSLGSEPNSIPLSFYMPTKRDALNHVLVLTLRMGDLKEHHHPHTRSQSKRSTSWSTFSTCCKGLEFGAR